MMAISPLRLRSRIHTLDFIRGLALLGILIINSQTYSLFAFLRPEQVYHLQLDQPDRYAPTQFFIHLLVKGQFYTLYSFLFGLSFYLMGETNERAGRDADHLAKRRLWALLLLGMIHALIFWFGDILHKYALLGFTLLYFNKKSVTVIIRWIVGLVVFVIACQTINTPGFPVSQAEMARHQREFDAVIMQVVTTWQHGSAGAVLRLQPLGVVMLFVRAVQQGLAPYVHYEIMFLLGLIAGKLQLFHRVAELKIPLLCTAFGIFPVALLLKGISGLPIFGVHWLPAARSHQEMLFYSLAEFISTPLLTVVYLIELTFLVTHLPARLGRWISNTGRLGLTNYLMQTLVCMLLFYGYAGGLAGRLTLLESLGVVGSLYAFQVAISNLWLRYYQQGPLEWLWRRLIYGKSRASQGAVPNPTLRG
ncbi:DUF418 domain-containing protein [Larkinella insperata]|uniref:DUF418 domain-containing protein n=1 Tax=Larkinella insperata TaxID=332158 RepID=A0ABW3Q7Z6_9BACT